MTQKKDKKISLLKGMIERDDMVRMNQKNPVEHAQNIDETQSSSNVKLHNTVNFETSKIANSETQENSMATEAIEKAGKVEWLEAAKERAEWPQWCHQDTPRAKESMERE